MTHSDSEFTKNTFAYGDFEVDVNLDAITPSMIWEGRHIEWKRKMESNAISDNFSYEERDIIIEKVRRCMEVMYDYVDEWLPDAFSLDDLGTVLNIQLNLLVSDMEEDVVEIFKTTSGRRKEALRELKKIVIEDLDNSETSNS